MLQNKKKQLFILFIVTIIGLLALEGFSYLLLSSTERSLPASAIMSSNHNQYLQEFSLKSGCTFAESIIAHPMLGFVQRRPEYLSKRCLNNFRANNIGVLSDRDLPLTKKDDEFSIMLLGGSVADHLANYKNGNDYFLEKVLNQKYIPPKGKRFTVYNGALGAWAMPAQVTMLLMYGERIDGAISLDGYNEAFPVQEGVRLERAPAGTYVLSFSDRGSLRVLGLRFLWAYQYVVSHSWLKHSYFFNTAYKAMTKFYEEHIISPSLIKEYTLGNSEDLHLPLMNAREWSLKSLGSYMQTFHQLGQAKKIKTAEFLQPTRFYGKQLTNEEKSYREYVDQSIFEKIEGLYRELALQKFPVKSLTKVFAGENETIYSDHIHYKTTDRRSKGKELVAIAIAEELGRMWNLKKR